MRFHFLETQNNNAVGIFVAVQEMRANSTEANSVSTFPQGHGAGPQSWLKLKETTESWWIKIQHSSNLVFSRQPDNRGDRVLFMCRKLTEWVK